MLLNINEKNIAKSSKIDWVWVKREVIRIEKISYANPEARMGAVLRSLETCFRKATTLTDPKFILAEKDIVTVTPEAIQLENGLSFTSKKIASYLNGASELIIFVATIGSRLETEATALMDKGNQIEGYLLDRIGSLAVESLAKTVEDSIRQFYVQQDASASARMSPGYCDWPTDEQIVMSKILDFSKAGIYLTDGCMMVPKKSISGIIGIGPKNKFSRRVSQCSMCEQEHCAYRR